MRTTIDIDDALYRKAKSFSALKGIKMKHFFQSAVRHELERKDTPILKPRQKTVFPLVSNGGKQQSINLSGNQIANILDDEDIDALT